MRLIIIAAACALAVLPSTALACKCVSGAPMEVYQRTQLLVEGKIVAVTQPEREPTTTRYTVQVAKAWKGAAEGDKVTVVTDKAGACAVKLAQGQTFIVAATDEGLGFASLKPCHPFFKAATARDAASTRKTLDGIKQQQTRGAAIAKGEKDPAEAEAAAAKALATAKKRKKR